MPWWPDAPASALLADPALVVPVVGAGLSVAAGLPGSAAVAARLAEIGRPAVDGAGTPGDLFSVADAVYRGGATRAELNSAIVELFDLANHPDVTPTGTHDALVRIESRLIVTFNYDLLLEEAARRQGIAYTSITHSDSELLVEHLRARDRRRLLVYHIHGSIADPDTIVVDDASYRRISNDLRVIRSLEYIADFTSLCFLGSRLDETYLQATLLRLPSVQPRHVLVTDAATAQELTTQRAALIPTRYGIVTAAFEKGRWDLIEGFAQRLVVRRPAANPPRAGAAKRPYRTFIEPKIRLVHGDVGLEMSSLVDLLFDSPENLGLWDVARTRRALVVGSAGIGKTSLLYRLAELSDELENPVMVNLRRVPLVRGTPEEILRVWLAGRTYTPPSARERDSRRLVVFLDGLDEVDHNLQAQIAETIAALAAAYPQFRFVVASRRIAALAILVSRGFAEFEVETDRNWAEEFLRTRGHDLSWLHKVLPEVTLLGPLSSNPFVLTVLTRIASNSPAQNEQPTYARIRVVLDQLIDRLIDREAHRMAYAREVLHRVVRELAVMQKLLGLKSVDVRTIGDGREILVEFGAESRADVLHDVARRCLIWTDGNEYAFADPLLCDHLAADYLLEHDPGAQIFTEVVTPALILEQTFSVPSSRRFFRSRTRSVHVDINHPRRVRSDLVSVAGMLAAGSAPWAQRLWSVDPVLVSVSISSRNHVISIGDRADLLWQRMIGPPDRPADPLSVLDALYGADSIPRSVPSEHAALQRLLQADGAAEITATIRTTLLDESASGAVRADAALALSLTDTIAEPELDRLLAKGPAELQIHLVGIVRRRGLSGLLPVIAQRVLSSADEPLTAELLEEIRGLCAETACARSLAEALHRTTPEPSGAKYWELLGVARMTIQPNEIIDLCTLAVHHRPEFLDYFGARPHVVGAMLLQFINALEADLISAPLSLLEELQTLVADMDPESAGATRMHTMLDPDSATTHGAKVATTHGTIVSSSGPPPGEESMPVLFPRLELSPILRSVVLGVSARATVEYASWLSPDAEARIHKIRHERDNSTDPLAELDRRLTEQVDSAAEWREWLPRVLPARPQLEALPLAIRAAVGARVEAAVAPIRPDSDLDSRLEFLRKYGRTLRLEPSPNEWIALAKQGPSGLTNWLRVTAPLPEFIHKAFGKASAADILGIVVAVPAGMRSWFAADVAAALATADNLTDEDLSRVAENFADSGDSASIRLLVDRFPDRQSALAGWAAATGDGAQLTFLLGQLVRDAKGSEELLSWRLRWIEQASTRALQWPDDTPRTLMQVLLGALARSHSDLRYRAIVWAIGTLMCSVAPEQVAMYCEMMRVASQWPAFKEPIGSLFIHAADRARVGKGAVAARELLGLQDLLGEREIVLYRSM